MAAFAPKRWEKSNWRNGWKKKQSLFVDLPDRNRPCKNCKLRAKRSECYRMLSQYLICQISWFAFISLVPIHEGRLFHQKNTLTCTDIKKIVKTGRRSSTVYPSHYLSGWRLREISKWCYSVFRFYTLAHSKADIIKFKSVCLTFVHPRFIHPLSKWTFIPKGEKRYHI